MSSVECHYHQVNQKEVESFLKLKVKSFKEVAFVIVTNSFNKDN